jgi:uncharacterized alpha-E superfamily protein
MLSRIADSLFWLNRYMERADGLLRSMKTNYILSLDKGINSKAYVEAGIGNIYQPG